MMVNAAATFVYSVLTFYTFYRYILQKDEVFGQLLWEQVKWEIFYLCSTLMVIYTTYIVSSEVNIGVQNETV